jgi:hypothetical protein
MAPDATEIVELIRILLMSVAGLVILVFGALARRALRQHQNAKSIAIRTPIGIDEAMFIPVGGIEQWITIRTGETVRITAPRAGHFAFESRWKELRKLLNERGKPLSRAPQLSAVVTKS